MKFTICKKCNQVADQCGHTPATLNGARLAQYTRRQLGLTQQEMAIRLGVSKRTLQYIEAGEKRLVPPESFAYLYLLERAT